MFLLAQTGVISVDLQITGDGSTQLSRVRPEGVPGSPRQDDQNPRDGVRPHHSHLGGGGQCCPSSSSLCPDQKARTSSGQDNTLSVSKLQGGDWFTFMSQ